MTTTGVPTPFDKLISAINDNLPKEEIEKIIDAPSFDANEIIQNTKGHFISPLGLAAGAGIHWLVKKLLEKGASPLPRKC